MSFEHIYQLRDEANRLIDLADPDNRFSYYRERIKAATKRRNFDLLEIIIWYFGEYWPSTNGEPEVSLITIEEESNTLRSSRGYGKVSRFVTVEAVNEIDRFTAAIHPYGQWVKQRRELINEVFVRPESGPVMEHLICERGIYDWEEIKPLVDEILAVEASALKSGLI